MAEKFDESDLDRVEIDSLLTAGEKAALKARIYSAAGSSQGRRATRRGRILLMYGALAACLFAALGLYVFHGPGSGAAVRQPGREEGISAASAYLLLGVEQEAETPVAVLQEMEGFSVVRKKPGEEIFGDTILAVQEGRLHLRSAGSERWVGSEELRSTFERAAASELQSAVAAFERGDLRPDQLNRVVNFSLLGVEGALALLDRVAESGSALPEGARPEWGDSRKHRYLKNLARRLADTTVPYRDTLISTLDRECNPLILSALCSIAKNPAESDDMRLLAIQTIASYGDSYAANALDEVQGKVEKRLVSEAANEARQRILSGLKPAQSPSSAQEPK